MAKKKNNEHRNKIIIGIIITIFMVSSIAAVVLYKPDDSDTTLKFKQTYSGKEYTFTRYSSATTSYYLVTAKGDSFVTYFTPDQLKTMDVDKETAAFIRDTYQFYLTFDPNTEKLDFIDFLRFDLGKNIPADRIFQDAVTEHSEIYPLPIITCENATLGLPVFFLSESNATSITKEGGCVSLKYKPLPYEFYTIRDFLVYSMHGIEVI